MKILVKIMEYKWLIGSILCCLIFFLLIFFEQFGGFFSFLISSSSTICFILLYYVLVKKIINPYEKNQEISRTIKLKSKIIPKSFSLKDDIPGEKKILFMENGPDIIAIGGIEIKSIPINIRANTIKFMRMMAKNKINFSILYSYSNNISQDYKKKEDESIFLLETQNKYEDRERSKKWQTRIIFLFYLKLRRKFNKNNLRKLSDELKNILLTSNSIFNNTFAHTQISYLNKKSLSDIKSKIISGGVF